MQRQMHAPNPPTRAVFLHEGVEEISIQEADNPPILFRTFQSTPFKTTLPPTTFLKPFLEELDSLVHFTASFPATVTLFQQLIFDTLLNILILVDCSSGELTPSALLRSSL